VNRGTTVKPVVIAVWALTTALIDLTAPGARPHPPDEVK